MEATTAAAARVTVTQVKEIPVGGQARGRPSEKAQRGKLIFQSQETRCAACHPAPLYTDSESHDVGSRTELDWAVGETLRGRVLCTVRLARKVVPEITRRSLDSLSNYFGVENEARHRAFGDARATAHIFAQMLHRLDDMQVQRWGELEQLLARRARRRKRRASPEPVREW